jgi:hypothetical protein
MIYRTLYFRMPKRTRGVLSFVVCLTEAARPGGPIEGWVIVGMFENSILVLVSLDLGTLTFSE